MQHDQWLAASGFHVVHANVINGDERHRAKKGILSNVRKDTSNTMNAIGIASSSQIAADAGKTEAREEAKDVANNLKALKFEQDPIAAMTAYVRKYPFATLHRSVTKAESIL